MDNLMEEVIEKLKKLYTDRVVSLAIVPKDTRYAYHLALEVETLKMVLDKLVS